MAENQRPRGRERNVTGKGTGVFKRGQGLGTGPTGASGLGQQSTQPGSTQSRPQPGSSQPGAGSQQRSSYNIPQGIVRPDSFNKTGQSSTGTGFTGTGQSQGTPPMGGSPLGNQQFGGTSSGSSGTTSTGQTRSGGKGKLLLFLLIAVAIVVIIIIIAGSHSKDSSSYPDYNYNYNNNSSNYNNNSSGSSSSSSSNSSSSSSGQSLDSLYSSYFGGSSSYSTGWTDTAASSAGAALDTTVASSAREKRTQILGNGRDKVTIMVYMCGADLESESGMASSDLKEMTNADLGDNINLIVYTGGAKKWQNNVVSSSVNQIYQVKNGGVTCLNSNAGNVSMTDPDTLSSFIQWGASNFPANRYELIFWDHGSGSISGYGYDEKFVSSGQMSLAGINNALKKGGVTFDFIGFDTCLLATMENALMLDSYADYMIASEETEPGIGWYYTDWLTKFGQNTSMATVDIGKNIIDDFISTCARQCQGQKATLSMTDLAELSGTAPAPFSAFSKSISSLISDNDYQVVSDARNQTREFASSSRIDQVDLVHLALNLGNAEGRSLADALNNAVKYNRTSSGMTNAYGLSIYFPYKNARYVDKVTSTYSQIGIDEEYSKCIKEFASLEVCGQAGLGGTSSPLSSLFGSYGSYSDYGNYSDYSSSSSYSSSSDMISELLGSFLGGGYGSISGLSSGNTGFLSGRSLTEDQMVDYISEHSLDPSALTFEEFTDGSYRMELSEDDWKLIHELDLNMFYDDGEGYINLGLDNVYDFDDESRLIADEGNIWLSINGQPVPYFHVDTVDDGTNYTITGRVPAILNGDTRIDLIIVFDNDQPNGYIAGAYYDYQEDDPIVPKNLTELNIGDTLDFICDYYSYDGTYEESYYMGNQMTVTENMEISDTYLDEGSCLIMYRFTDLFDREYWSAPLVR